MFCLRAEAAAAPATPDEAKPSRAEREPKTRGELRDEQKVQRKSLKFDKLVVKLKNFLRLPLLLLLLIRLTANFLANAKSNFSNEKSNMSLTFDPFDCLSSQQSTLPILPPLPLTPFAN